MTNTNLFAVCQKVYAENKAEERDMDASQSLVCGTDESGGYGDFLFSQQIQDC
jgi:hypothetical protein